MPYIIRQDRSTVKVSTPPTMPTARCGGTQADCADGLPPEYSAEEIARRRTNVADAASNFGTQAGRVAAASAAIAASTPNPVVAATAGAVAAASTAASLAAGALEQVARPDVGQYTAESLLGVGGYYLGERFPMAGPPLNEAAEAIKATDTMNNVKSWINERWNKRISGKSDEAN